MGLILIPLEAGTIAPVDWREHTLATLDAAGFRRGGARSAVVDVLAHEDCCLSAQEIHDRLRSEGRKAGIASVYRVLELLTTEGFVQRIDLGSGMARYEPIQRDGDHHHHLVCDSCGKVEAFEDDDLELALDRLERSSGYRVAGHDVVLHGACASCR
jgi:Fur family ferric uptake transcriptional regulator